jgi:hypothetical protein
VKHTNTYNIFLLLEKASLDPKAPNSDLIKAIVEIKQRNPNFGYPRIALIMTNTFDFEINKDIVRRALMKHYHPSPDARNGPSWLSFIANMKDSLWSSDLFYCEPITLKTHWAFVIMDVWSRCMIGCSVNKGFLDVPTLCRMFNQIISNNNMPHYTSTDNDPLFEFH